MPTVLEPETVATAERGEAVAERRKVNETSESRWRAERRLETGAVWAGGRGEIRRDGESHDSSGWADDGERTQTVPQAEPTRRHRRRHGQGASRGRAERVERRFWAVGRKEGLLVQQADGDETAERR